MCVVLQTIANGLKLNLERALRITDQICDDHRQTASIYQFHSSFGKFFFMFQTEPILLWSAHWTPLQTVVTFDACIFTHTTKISFKRDVPSKDYW